MGSRDRGRKEPKKPKKDAKKIPQVTIMTTPTEVEVIKKGKQREGRRVGGGREARESSPSSPGTGMGQEWLTMADLASLQATVRGRVHGVFFRAFVETWAEELRLTGFVRNRPDGTVEVGAEGERQKLEKLVEYLKTGPPAARVEEVVVAWAEYTGEFPGFSVKY